MRAIREEKTTQKNFPCDSRQMLVIDSSVPINSSLCLIVVRQNLLSWCVDLFSFVFCLRLPSMIVHNPMMIDHDSNRMIDLEREKRRKAAVVCHVLSKNKTAFISIRTRRKTSHFSLISRESIRRFPMSRWNFSCLDSTRIKTKQNKTNERKRNTNPKKIYFIDNYRHIWPEKKDNKIRDETRFLIDVDMIRSCVFAE